MRHTLQSNIALPMVSEDTSNNDFEGCLVFVLHVSRTAVSLVASTTASSAPCRRMQLESASAQGRVLVCCKLTDLAVPAQLLSSIPSKACVHLCT